MINKNERIFIAGATGMVGSAIKRAFVKENSESGFVSAGNTAALMILSRFILGMIDGVDRPAICSKIPSNESFSLMMDLGANVYVSAENLLQFALMGYTYFSIIDPERNPKIIC